MKLLFGYTIDYIRRNRRSSLAIMIAILMASTLLSALCGLLYNLYTDNLSYYLSAGGNWHSELFDNNYGRDLEIIEGFESVETTLIKGPWMVAAIDDPRRDYLAFRNADPNYWESMPEGSVGIMEGKAPSAAGEIGLSKQYFENHPDLKLGDTITLPLGNRMTQEGEIISPVDKKHKGESFVPTGSISLKVVAKMDVATSSTVPCYSALGYLDRTTLAPQDEVTVYMRFKQIGDTYRETPRIAEAVGYTVDEYGEYNVRYNSDYLSRRFVFSPLQMSAMEMFVMSAQPLMFALMGLLTAGVLVMVIHNAFALSAESRLKQLGVLASVGATPRQIKRSLELEALLLSAIPLPLGLALGQLAVWVMIHSINSLGSQLIDFRPVTFVFGWTSVLPSILLTLLTVWWAAAIPARRVARMSPIAAIRQAGTVRSLKPRKHRFIKKLGIAEELALTAVRARRRSYRTSAISLLLSFLTLTVLLGTTSATKAEREIYSWITEYRWAEADIEVTLHNIEGQADYEVTDEFAAIDGITGAAWYSTQTAALWVAEDELSPQLRAIGGFENISDKLMMRMPLLRDGSYRVITVLAGLDDNTFAGYCQSLGLDANDFYNEDCLDVILCHMTEDITRSSKSNPIEIPILDVVAGDTLNCTEKYRDDIEGEIGFVTRIAAITNQYPPIGTRSLAGRMGVVQILPMSRLRELTKSFSNDHTNRVRGVVQVESPQMVDAVCNRMDNICSAWFGSGDYTLFTEQEQLLSRRNGDMVVNIMFGFVVGLFAVIGISNAWATVRGNLSSRRREFAVLRSVGLPPSGICRIMLYEALLLGLMPFILALPIAIGIQAFFLHINEVSFVQWLPYAPWQLPVYILSVLLVICAAYISGGRALLSQNIIDVVRADTI